MNRVLNILTKRGTMGLVILLLYELFKDLRICQELIEVIEKRRMPRG